MSHRIARATGWLRELLTARVVNTTPLHDHPRPPRRHPLDEPIDGDATAMVRPYLLAYGVGGGA